MYLFVYSFSGPLSRDCANRPFNTLSDTLRVLLIYIEINDLL